MSANDKADAAWNDYVFDNQETEIEKLKEQIKRLIEAGDEMHKYIGVTHDSDKWNEAKEKTKQ